MTWRCCSPATQRGTLQRSQAAWRCCALLFCSVLFARAACGRDPALQPSTEYPHAHAFADCAPWDGAATRVVLTREPAAPRDGQRPSVEIWVWRTLTRAEGERFRLDPGGNDWGAVYHCVTDRQCEPAERGYVRLASLGGDGVLDGTLDVSWPGGKRLAASFRATWHEVSLACV